MAKVSIDKFTLSGTANSELVTDQGSTKNVITLELPCGNAPMPPCDIPPLSQSSANATILHDSESGEITITINIS